jgi:hypothetical protein
MTDKAGTVTPVNVSILTGWFASNPLARREPRQVASKGPGEIVPTAPSLTHLFRRLSSRSRLTSRL